MAEDVTEWMGLGDPAEADRLLGTDRRAKEIALKRYGRPFAELPPQEQMRVWLEAEGRVDDER